MGQGGRSPGKYELNNMKQNQELFKWNWVRAEVIALLIYQKIAWALLAPSERKGAFPLAC